MIYHSAVLFLFLWNTIQDIKYKSLRNRGLLAGGVFIFLLVIADGLYSGKLADILLSKGGFPWQNLWGVLPGVCLLLVSWLAEGCIGKGDGYLVCISGLALGFKTNLSLLFYALLLAGGISAVLLSLRKVKKDTKLPFVPFLLGGYLLTLLQYI